MSTLTRTCDRCGVAKPATEQYFGPNLRNYDGLKDYCRACSPAVTAERRRSKTERSREWARNNPEKVRESSQRTYEKNRRARLAYMRRWRAENRERVAEYQREYRERKSAEGEENSA